MYSVAHSLHLHQSRSNKVKISKETLDIFHNFSKLNNGLVFKAGNKIKTRHQKAAMPIAEVVVPEEFPRDFAIAELPKFLSVFTLLDNPELDFTEDSIILTDATNRSAKIRYAAETMVVHMDYKIGVALPSVDASFELSEANYKAINKAASAFVAPEIAFIGDGSTLKLSTYNTRNSRADSFMVDIGETDKVFTMIIDVNHLQMLMRSYKVDICFRGILQFTSETEHNTLKYWIAASEKSKVG